MSAVRITLEDHRIQEALAELKGLIQARYPTAAFDVAPGEDPEGVYLTTIVDVDDLTAVIDVVVDRLVEFQVEEALPVYVVPTRPLNRVLEELRSQPAKQPSILTAYASASD